MTREKRLRDIMPLKAEEVKGQVVTHASHPYHQSQVLFQLNDVMLS